MPADFYYKLEIPDEFFKDSKIPQVYENGLPNVSVDKDKYQACESVIVTSNRITKIDAETTIVKDLVQLKEVGRDEKFIVQNEVFISSFSSAPDGVIISRTFQLPCELEKGKYYRWEGSTNFEVHQIKKTYVWQSEIFYVE